MDLRQLEYAEAVGRHLSFTRAAEELRVAQPALSFSIRRLESELGVRLFDRTSRRVSLTDAGQAFVETARGVLADVAQLQSEMSHYADGTRGVLRTSWWYHLDSQGVAFLRAYSAANPGVRVSVVEYPARDSLDMLRSGELDIALVLRGEWLDLTGIEHRVIRTEPYVLVTPIDHPFASRGSVAIDELAQERFIAPLPGTAIRQCFDLALEGRGAPPIVVETNEFAAMLELVSTGVGCAVVTPSIATRIGFPVGFVRIEGSPPFVLAVAWTAGPHDRAVQRAIDLLIA